MVGAWDRRQAMAGLAALLAAGCSGSARATRPAAPAAMRLIAAARRQIGVTLAYDPAYSRLAFPGGDVDRAKGVCTDVVIRAYRDSLGLDLQLELHRDIAAAYARYPQRWGLRGPDRNIDHRRVPNLETFWTRKGARLPLPADRRGWQPGDLFTALIGGRLPHTGILSDRIGPSGNPLVIHNIGSGTREEDALFDHALTGRFRWRL